MILQQTQKTSQYFRKILHWIFIVLWMGIIFYFSNQPDLKSSLPNDWDFIFRKIAHISEFAVLNFLLIKTFSHYKISFKNILIISFSMSFLYAVLDEYHQNFVLGRHGSVKDILIDSLGIMIVTIFYPRKNTRINLRPR
jgi:VanZ family protein